jgi:hypothetical protein
MGVRGDFTRIGDLKRALRDMPRTVAAAVATKAAPSLTSAARGSYEGGQNVYGDQRPASKVDGHPLSLVATGDTLKTVRFTNDGGTTTIRAVLGPKYARYLIGLYQILPGGKSAIPASWNERLRAILAATKPEV